MLAALASSPATKALDPDPFPRHSLRHAVYAALLHFGFETATQIWIAVSVYVLVAIVKKRLGLDASLYTLLQVFSVTLFEKMPMSQAFSETTTTSEPDEVANQLNLFAY